MLADCRRPLVIAVVFAPERHRAIESVVRQKGRMTVLELVRQLGASDITIRRELRTVVNLFQIPAVPGIADHCTHNILTLKPQGDHYGMPLMVEPLVLQRNDKAGGYLVGGDVQKISPLVRQGVELGADIIKADPSTPVDRYHEVIK